MKALAEKHFIHFWYFYKTMDNYPPKQHTLPGTNLATCLFQMKKKKSTSDTLLHVDCQIMNFDIKNIRKMKLNKLLLCSMKDACYYIVIGGRIW